MVVIKILGIPPRSRYPVASREGTARLAAVQDVSAVSVGRPLGAWVVVRPVETLPRDMEGTHQMVNVIRTSPRLS